MYFRTALILGDANLRPFIELLPWFLIVIGPALAMRAFADEYGKGTIELLYTHPLSEWTIAASKFVGILLFFGVILLSTLSLPITIMVFANPDLGLLLGQYLGAFFIGGVFLAVGLAASAFVTNTVGSFLIGAAVNFGLMLMGLNFVIMALPAPLSKVFIELGVISHLNNISRGVLDLRDVLYFATIIGIALAAAVVRLSERKLAENPAEKKKLWVIMALIIGIGIVGNILMLEFPLRVDLTASQRYSLSVGTKKLLKELPDKVSVTLFTSQNLPGPMQVTLRETSDRLKDFSRFGDRLQVDTVIVSVDPESRSDAIQQGIREVQINQVSAGSFQMQTGFLGILLRYGEKTEVIDFVENAADLEYSLSRLILKMTRDELPKLGVIEANERVDTLLSQYLSEQYEMVSIGDENIGEDLSKLAAILVVDDGSGTYATASAKVENYIANGGSVLALVDGVNVNQQTLLVTQSRSEFVNIFSVYGVRVNKDLVYDLLQNELINVDQAIFSYPFWIRASLNQDEAPWSGAATNALLGWSSSLQIPASGDEGLEIVPILTTGPSSGTQTSAFTIQPSQLETLPESDGSVSVLGILMQKEAQRLVLVGDSHIVADDFLQNTIENQSFIANMVDWVAADEILALIPKRGSDRTVFTFTSPSQIPMVQYGNILIPPVLVSGFGFWWLRRRKLMTKRRFDAEK